MILVSDTGKHENARAHRHRGRLERTPLSSPASPVGHRRFGGVSDRRCGARLDRAPGVRSHARGPAAGGADIRRRWPCRRPRHRRRCPRGPTARSCSALRADDRRPVVLGAPPARLDHDDADRRRRRTPRRRRPRPRPRPRRRRPPRRPRRPPRRRRRRRRPHPRPCRRPCRSPPRRRRRSSCDFSSNIAPNPDFLSSGTGSVSMASSSTRTPASRPGDVAQLHQLADVHDLRPGGDQQRPFD